MGSFVTLLAGLSPPRVSFSVHVYPDCGDLHCCPVDPFMSRGKRHMPHLLSDHATDHTKACTRAPRANIPKIVQGVGENTNYIFFGLK